MAVLDFHAAATQGELLDAGEGLTTLFDNASELDLPRPLVYLLANLDDAITAALMDGGALDAERPK